MDQLSRRAFVVGAGLTGFGLLAGCGRWPGPGQQPPRVPRIGFLAVGSREGRTPVITAFLEGLQELGYVEGQNVAIEYRFGETDEALAALTAELVALPVDLILASGTNATVAAKRATTTIPIVMGSSGDPVATGLVASLARPGGNVTGMSVMASQMSGKRLELLKETIPGLSRLAVISNETNPIHVPRDQEIAAAARALGIQMDLLSVRSADEFEGAFQAATSAHADAVYPAEDPIVVNARQQLAELALRYRFPTVFVFRENVEAGGLLAYGPAFASMYRRAAYYVDRILKGTKPADLPIEQPMTFDFVVNLKTAQALGITFPNEIMLQVTEVVE